MQLGGLEGESILCHVEELQCQILADSGASRLTSKKGLPPGPAVRIIVTAERLILDKLDCALHKRLDIHFLTTPE